MDRISLELTRRCAKACWFCYSESNPSGETRWPADDVVAFATDCASNGVRAISFGGGEPLEYPALFEVLERLSGVLFRSLTTNGLLLTRDNVAALVQARPDKIHVSIHFPSDVERVAEQVAMLGAVGLRAGVNLLVARSRLEEARDAAAHLHARGILNDRIVYLPMRGNDTPTPEDVARVAVQPFQSTSCLRACGRSERFCSVGWDRSVAWCSHTRARSPLAEPTFAALSLALDGPGVDFCGGTPDELVRLSRGPQHGHGVVRD